MKIRAFFGWGGLTALLVLLLGGNALWIAHVAHVPVQGGTATLVWGWLGVLACLAVISVLAGYLANGRAIGIFIDDRNRVSLTRFQWLLWFLVLFSAYFTGAIWNGAIGADLPAAEADLFWLLGITTGSAVVSTVLVDAKKQTANPAAATDTTLIGTIDRNVAPGEASWSDLYLGEEQANRDGVDVSRLQKVVVTVLLVIVYIEMLWAAFSQIPLGSHPFAMPTVGNNFVGLLGLSHAGYLASKAASKTAAPPVSLSS